MKQSGVKCILIMIATFQLVTCFIKVLMPKDLLDQFSVHSAAGAICQIKLQNNAVFFCNDGFVGIVDAKKLFGFSATYVLSNQTVQDSSGSLNFDLSFTLEGGP